MKSLVELQALQAKAEARAARRALERQVLASLPPDASGREIVAARRLLGGTVSANQQAAKDRAKQRRIEKGKANQAKFEAKVAARRAAKETLKQDALQAKAAQFAAVVAATAW